MTHVRQNQNQLSRATNANAHAHSNTGARHPESLKKKAVVLRRLGHTYSEILKEIPVAKSTLSLWLGEVDLSKKQKQKITEKKLAAAKRGGEARRTQRLESSQVIMDKARAEVGNLSKRELLIVGAALYWAEGDKQKAHSPSTRFGFINSDPRMIHLCLRWLKEICEVADKDVTIDLVLHENHAHRLAEVIKYWSRETHLPKSRFATVYYKKDWSRLPRPAPVASDAQNTQNTTKTRRRPRRHNTGNGYYGILKLRVRRSVNLNRRIAGWVDGIVEGVGDGR